MTEIEELKKDVMSRRNENLALSMAYTKTLNWLMPANFVLVIGAALLSLVAGASILTRSKLLTEMAAGVLALVSSAFTIIHSKMGCEQYQAECKKLRSFHRGMAADLSNLLSIDDVHELRKKLSALNDQVSVTMKSTTAYPFEHTLEAARKHVA